MICNTCFCSVLILNLPTSSTISLTWFSFFFFSPLYILRNTRSETDTNRNTRRPWTCHLPSSFPTLWSQTRWGHSFTPLLCRIVTGKVKYCCRAGWLHCVLNNFCYSSSLSFTHPDIFSPISNWHYFDNCLSLFRCFSLVPVLPFRSTIIRLFLPFCFPPPDLQQWQLRGRCHLSAGFLTEATRRRHRPVHQRQLSRSVVHSL